MWKKSELLNFFVSRKVWFQVLRNYNFQQKIATKNVCAQNVSKTNACKKKKKFSNIEILNKEIILVMSSEMCAKIITFLALRVYVKTTIYYTTIGATTCSNHWPEPIECRVQWMWRFLIGSRQQLLQTVARKKGPGT